MRPTARRCRRARLTALIKANTQPTATIGEEFTYRITVPTTPHLVPLYDVRILDDLGASAADLSLRQRDENLRRRRMDAG